MDDINPLDRARAEEARRQISEEDPKHMPRVDNVATRAAMLARTGWEPEDPDLIAAREVAKGVWFSPALYEELDAGGWDHSGMMKVALAAIKRGRELERGGR